MGKRNRAMMSDGRTKTTPVPINNTEENRRSAEAEIPQIPVKNQDKRSRG